MKLFRLVREQDMTGLSSVGVVAEGVEFNNGKVILCWLGKISSVVIYNNLAKCKQITCSHSKSTIEIFYNCGTS